MKYVLRVYQHIDEIGQLHWDALTEPPSFFMSYAWLRSVEGMLAPRSYYLTIWSAAGDLLGAVPCYVVDDEHAYPYFNPPLLVLGSRTLEMLNHELTPHEAEQLSRSVEVLGPPKRWYPSLVAAAPYGYTVSVRQRRDVGPDVRQEITDRLVSAFVELAAQEGARSSAFLYTTDDAASVTAAPRERNEPQHQANVVDDGLEPLLTQQGYLRRALDSDCILPVAWHTFEEYIATRPQRRRTAVRKETRIFEQHGLSIAVEGMAALNSDLAPLQASLSEKYGRRGDLGRITQGYDRIAKFLGPSVRVFLARKCGQLVGFALYYQAGTTLYCKQAGFDYTRLADDFCYFNVVFYEPIRYAIAAGIRTIHYGLEAYEAKLARGCVLRRLDGHVHLRDAPIEVVRQCIELQDHASRARLARLERLQSKR